MLKKIITILIALAVLTVMGAVPVDAKSQDKAVVEKYVTEKYDKPVKYVSEGSSLIDHRKNKKYVVVEELKTTCKGGRKGVTSDGYGVRYCKADKKGAKVKVYLVYNPKNNAPDDVVTMVDHGKRK